MISAVTSTISAAIGTTFWLMLSALALPLLPPPLPVSAVAAVGCGIHCHWPQTAAPCPLLLTPQLVRCPRCRYHRRRCRCRRRRLCVAACC
jgi:hypothetical protein